MTVEFVRSDDGTRIAYEVSGSGPLLIVVNGALSTRGAGEELAGLLSPHFRVLRYDRRGRGYSSDAGPYSTQR
jgi:pimeloyl-ACP methyl ester carboxylesterase